MALFVKPFFKETRGSQLWLNRFIKHVQQVQRTLFVHVYHQFGGSVIVWLLTLLANCQVYAAYEFNV